MLFIGVGTNKRAEHPELVEGAKHASFDARASAALIHISLKLAGGWNPPARQAGNPLRGFRPGVLRRTNPRSGFDRC